MRATHSRDQWHDVEIGFDDDGHILAVCDDYLVDCGASNPIGSGVAYHTAVHLTGPYKIENLAASGRIAVTNKVPNAPYRGAGRPEAAFAMERAIDLVARTLGLEPAEVRRRNMIRADEMPYRVGIPYRESRYGLARHRNAGGEGDADTVAGIVQDNVEAVAAADRIGCRPAGG